MKQSVIVITETEPGHIQLAVLNSKEPDDPTSVVADQMANLYTLGFEQAKAAILQERAGCSSPSSDLVQIAPSADEAESG